MENGIVVEIRHVRSVVVAMSVEAARAAIEDPLPLQAEIETALERSLEAAPATAPSPMPKRKYTRRAKGRTNCPQCGKEVAVRGLGVHLSRAHLIKKETGDGDL